MERSNPGLLAAFALIEDDFLLDPNPPMRRSSDGPTTVDEIVVTAKRKRPDPNQEEAEQVSDPNDPGGGLGGGGGSGGNWDWHDPTPPPTVTHDGSDLARQAAEHFVERVDELDEIIDALDPAASYTMPDGRLMSGADIQNMWRSMSFHFNSGTSFGTDPSRAGENNNSHVTMDAGRYFGYLASYGDATGAYFFALHELGHVSDTNNWADNHFWQLHVQNGGTTADWDHLNPYFQNNEVYANQNATYYANLMGLDFPTNATHGFIYDYAFY